jgi:hypothetical protein
MNMRRIVFALQKVYFDDQSIKSGYTWHNNLPLVASTVFLDIEEQETRRFPTR